MKISIGIADHPEFFAEIIREGLVPVPDLDLIVHAQNGWLLKHELEQTDLRPDVILLNTEMGVMDGVETTLWIREHAPSIKLVAMSGDHKDAGIRKMLQAGCCGFFFKATALEEFATAIRRVHSKGYYNPEAHNILLKNPFRRAAKEIKQLTEDEQYLVDLSCGDLSYEEIRAELNLTTRQVNRLIDRLLNKFHVYGRNGLVLEALREGFCLPAIIPKVIR